MARKVAKKKRKRFSVSLSEKEGEMLQRYAKANGISRTIAIRHILRETLKDYDHAVATQQPSNQLGLFDSIQIDIFNNTSKVEK